MKRRGTWEFPNRVELTAALIPRLMDYGSPPIVPRVLDACNKFIDPRMGRACAEKGYRLTACDIEPENYAAVQADLNKPMAWKDGWFRGIVSSDTLEHCDDMGAALKEFYRVTEPVGWLILHLPVDLVSVGLRAKTERSPEGDKDRHIWCPGMNIEDEIKSAGYRVAGRVEGYDRDIFHVSVAWLCVKETK